MSALSDHPSLPVADPASAEEAMKALYRQHGRFIYRFLLRLTFGDRQESEDILQETLLRAWRGLRDQTLDEERARRWMYTVARRVAIDVARMRRARPAEVAGLDLTGLPSPGHDIDRILAIQSVRRGLMTLSPEHRSVLVETYYHDRSIREAAVVLGIPEGTVKSRMFYALRALAKTTAAAA